MYVEVVDPIAREISVMIFSGQIQFGLFYVIMVKLVVRNRTLYVAMMLGGSQAIVSFQRLEGLSPHPLAHQLPPPLRLQVQQLLRLGGSPR
jgi:hypothetical protein